MDSIYVVPIIPHNLSKNETIIQIAEVLDHLGNVTDSILKRITDRVENNSKKLTDISNRIDKVHSKVNKLSGAKKATQVFSSSKYPATDLNREYVSIFKNVEPVILTRHKVKHKNFQSDTETLDKLQIYHVKLTENDSNENRTGLGETPSDIECLNDVLLYNTGKNLYENFVMSDALDVTQQVREHYVETSDIEPAPHSIAERSNLTRSTTQNYFYTPNLGEVPTLDVPLDLPDLPGIADDLRYEIEVGPGIAPSDNSTSHIPELPKITDNEPEIQEISPIVNLPAPPPIGAVITKEQQPVPVEKSISEVDIQVPEPPIPKTEAIEAPKLPPPPIEILEKVSSPLASNGHASLMEAIRNAGGSRNAKLKSVDNIESDNKKNTATSGGDLMADLHAKLSMRRKGISGTKKPDINNSEPTSAMDRISAMIPPPNAKSDNDSANTEDEDWDE